jgi:PAS domain S-box-containing protein
MTDRESEGVLGSDVWVPFDAREALRASTGRDRAIVAGRVAAASLAPLLPWAFETYVFGQPYPAPFILVLPFVLLAAWLAGWQAGAVATGIGLFAGWDLLSETTPFYASMTDLGGDDLMASTAFVVCGVLACGFVDHVRRTQLQLLANEQDRERRVNDFSESAEFAIVSADSAGNIVAWNRSAEKTFGYTEAEAIGKSLTLIIPPKFREAHHAGMTRFRETGVPRVIGNTVELTAIHRDGREFEIELSLSTWMDRGERYFTGILHDVSLRKAAQRRLEDAANQLRSMVEYAPYGQVLVSPEGRIELVNAQLERDTGFARDELVGQGIETLVPERFRETYLKDPQPRGLGGSERNLFVRTRDGGEFPAAIALMPVQFETGQVTLVSITNLTERRAAEDALEDLAYRLDRATEAGQLGVWEYRPATGSVVVFGETTRARGHAGTGQQELGWESFLSAVHEDDRPRVRARFFEGTGLPPRGVSHVAEEYRLIDGDGVVRHVAGRARIETDEQGRVSLVTGTEIDVTEAKRTGDMLRETQKLEAVGQLSGGLAHDFNNLLGIVIGNLDLLVETIPASEPQHGRAQVALGAAERAAEVTRSLLKVARRQPLEVEDCELNAVVRELQPLVETSLGKSVRVEFALSEAPLQLAMDAQGLSHTLLNLAINARDALTDFGGDARVVVRTSLVHLSLGDHPTLPAGDFVSLSMQDNGPGMPAEVSERVFEPFFTTKEAGHGTGLGLAMVRGFAEQLGGAARIHSVVGEGTTVELLFPAHGKD